MYTTATQLLRAALGEVSLNILLFGPPIRHLTNDPQEKPLQDKRLDISQALQEAGHNVRFAEDVVEPGFATNLPYAVIMREYDVVFSYVSSDTSVTELEIIRSDEEVAGKSLIFLDTREADTPVGELCANACACGAMMKQYLYPQDIHSCNLLGETLLHVEIRQAEKFAL